MRPILQDIIKLALSLFAVEARGNMISFLLNQKRSKPPPYAF